MTVLRYCKNAGNSVDYSIKMVNYKDTEEH